MPLPLLIPIVSSLLGAFGAKKSADAQKDAANAAASAAQFHPFDINGPFGSVLFGRSPGTDITGQFNDSVIGRVLAQDPRFQNFGAGNPTNTVTVNPDQATSDIRGLLSSLALSRLGGQSATSPFQSFATGVGNESLPGLFSGALSASTVLPTQEFGAYSGLLGQLTGQTAGAASGLLSQAGSSPNAGLASLLSGTGLGAISDALGGGLSQAADAANVSFDPTNLITDRLNLLRQQAAPQEEQAFNSLQQRLFNQGRLGSTGGSQNIEAFARGLGQADLGRQVEAQNLGMAATQQAANIGLNRAGLLGNLAGLGASTGQGLLNQAQGFQGLDVNRALGLAGLAPSLFGLAGNFAGNQYNAALGLSDLTNARAQQRLANAQALFGFGNSLGTQDYNQALSALQGTQSIDTSLRNLIALGGNIGGQQAAAGGNVAQALLSNNESPIGGFLGGLSSALIGSYLNKQQGTTSNG